MLFYTGATEDDYPLEEIDCSVTDAENLQRPKKSDSVSSGISTGTTDSGEIGGITLVQCNTGPGTPNNSPVGTPSKYTHIYNFV